MKGWSEKEFTKAVLNEATRFGWSLSYHPLPATVAKGKIITPYQGNGKGFPDLILLKSTCGIVAELKVGNNKPTSEQQKWLEAFRALGFIAEVWYPRDWDRIVSLLSGGRASSLAVRI